MVRVHVRPPSSIRRPLGGRLAIFGNGRETGSATAIPMAGIRGPRAKREQGVPPLGGARDSFLLEVKQEARRRGAWCPARRLSVKKQARGLVPRATNARPAWRQTLAPRLHGRAADALAAAGDEGRGKLRKSPGRRMRPLIRGCPNGATRPPRGGRPRPNP